MKQSILLLFVFVSFSLAAQSPWPRSKAGFFAQASWNFIPTYTTLFGGHAADIVLQRKVTEQYLQLYGEYGLSKKTTIFGSLPLGFNKRGAVNPDYTLLNTPTASGQIAGLGNTTLAIRHQFGTGRVAWTGTFKLGLPAATGYKEVGLRTGYNALTLLPMINAGMGFHKLYWYAYGGYGYRSNGYSHFLNFGGELGFHLGKVWLMGFFETVYPVENGTRQSPPIAELTGLYLNNQGWVSIGLKATWELNRFWGINFSGAGAVWAQNVPQSPGLGLGLYFKWD